MTPKLISIAGAVFAVGLMLTPTASATPESAGGGHAIVARAGSSSATSAARVRQETPNPQVHQSQPPDDESQSNDVNDPQAVSADGTGRPCRWWQFKRCDHTDEPDVEGLPDGAPRTGTIITVDLSTNTLYLFREGQLVLKSPVATGSGKVLENGEDMWAFETPRGHMKVKAKIVDPVWRKPDWAYIEAGLPVPRADDSSRYVKGHLGKYALSLGDGIMIHGTDDPSSIGHRVSHGCIRLPQSALNRVYASAKVGTDVFVFDSKLPQQATTNGIGEHHSDLDYAGSPSQ